MYAKQKKIVRFQKPPRVRPSSPKRKQTVVLKNVPVQKPAQRRTVLVQPAVDPVFIPGVFTPPPLSEIPAFTNPPAYESIENSYPMTLEIIQTPEPTLYQYDLYTSPSPFLL